MSEQTNPAGSQRSDRDVRAEMTRLFSGVEQPKEDTVNVQDLIGDDEEIPAFRQKVGEAGEDEEEDELEDGEQADPDEEGEPTSEFQWTLSVNGQEQVITDEEEARLLAQRGAHYTQEMQALRAKEREFDAERRQINAQIRQKEQQYVEALKTLESTFAPVLGQEPDWNTLYSENPVEYAHIRAQWDQLSAIRSEQKRIAAERQAEAQQEMARAAQREMDELFAKLPEWNDPVKQKADINMIRDYAYTVGYSDEDLGQLWNHRDFLVLRDAARYRHAQEVGRKEVKKAAKTVEPGKSQGEINQQSRRQRQQRERARKTGKVDDIAPLMLQLLKK